MNQVSLGSITEESNQKNKDLNSYPVFSVTNEKGIVYSEDFFKKRVYSKNLKNYKIIEPKEIAYNPSRINVGSVAINQFDKKGLLSPLYVIVKTNSEIIPQFLVYYLKSNDGLNQIKHFARGTVRDSLNYTNFCKIKIKLPDIPEQQKTILKIKKVEEIIKIKEKNLNLISNLIYSILFQHIEKHSESKKWKSTTFQKLLIENSLNGISKKPHEKPEGTQILRISSVTSNYGVFVNVNDFKYLKISNNEQQKYALQKGDLLSCRYNGNRKYVGKFALFSPTTNESITYPDKLIRFRVDVKQILPEFAVTYLNSDYGRSKIEPMCFTTAGNYGIRSSDLKNMEIILPPLKIQQAVVIKLQSIFRIIEKLNHSNFQDLLNSVINMSFGHESRK